jgi:hypothetical protein
MMNLNQEITGIQKFFKTNWTFLLFDPNWYLLKGSDPIKIQASHGLYISCTLSAYYISELQYSPTRNSLNFQILSLSFMSLKN